MHDLIAHHEKSTSQGHHENIKYEPLLKRMTVSSFRVDCKNYFITRCSIHILIPLCEAEAHE